MSIQLNAGITSKLVKDWILMRTAQNIAAQPHTRSLHKYSLPVQTILV